MAVLRYLGQPAVKTAGKTVYFLVDFRGNSLP